MSSSQNVILVTGATGSVGSATLDSLTQLSAANVTVRAQIREENQKDDIKKHYPQAEFALIDYDDIDSVFSALKGVTTLFIVTPYTYKQLVIARLLVDAAKAAGTTYIVHLGVSQPEKSAGDYIAWHLLTEKYIEASGVKWVHLRPNMFLDNLQEYGNIHTFQNGTLTFPLKPDLKLPWVTTEDIGAVSAAVLVNPSQYASQVIPITSELNSVHGVVQAIQQVRDGKPVKLDTPSTEQFYKQLVDAGGDPAYFHGFKVNVDEHNQLDDATKAWGAKEGLDAVRSIAKKEPMTSSEWARKYKETFAQ